MLAELSISKAVPINIYSFLEKYYKINHSADWIIDFENQLFTLSNKQNKLFYNIDLNQGHYHYRNHHQAKEPLLKAIKIYGKYPKKIIDATPGALKDSFLMAHQGIHIIAIERNPLIYTLLKQSLLLTKANNIQLIFADSIKEIKNYPADLIYIDPMYPPRKKSALVKKDMQVLQAIVGKDSDGEQLLHAAINSNIRTVVKRPHYAKPLSNIPIDLVSKQGSSTRFDIYLPKDQ